LSLSDSRRIDDERKGLEASREWYRIPGIAESMVAATLDEVVNYYRELGGVWDARYFFVTIAPPEDEALRLLAEQVMPRVAV
jgi:hypothetical protein